MGLQVRCQNEATLFTESQNYLRDKKSLTEQVRRLCLMFSLPVKFCCFMILLLYVKLK